MRGNHIGTIMKPNWLHQRATDMPALTVKKIPDELYEHLKASAQAHHRSINSELIHCLETVLLPRQARPEEIVATARALRRQVKAKRISLKDIDAAKNEGRK